MLDDVVGRNPSDSAFGSFPSTLSRLSILTALGSLLVPAGPSFGQESQPEPVQLSVWVMENEIWPVDQGERILVRLEGRLEVDHRSERFMVARQTKLLELLEKFLVDPRHQHVTIQLRVIPWRDLRAVTDDLTVAFASPAGGSPPGRDQASKIAAAVPDVIQFGTTVAPAFDTYLFDMREVFQKEETLEHRYDPVILESARAPGQGAVYGLPLYCDLRALLIDLHWFIQAQLLDISEVDTNTLRKRYVGVNNYPLDRFSNDCDALWGLVDQNELDTPLAIVKGIGRSYFERDVLWSYILPMTVAPSGSQLTLVEDNLGFRRFSTDPDRLERMAAFVHRLHLHSATSPNLSSRGIAEHFLRPTRDYAAMIVATPGLIPLIEETPLPEAPSNGRDIKRYALVYPPWGASFLGGSLLSLLKNGKAAEPKEEAVSLLRHLCLDAKHQIEYGKSAGSLPSLKAALDDPKIAEHPLLSVYRDMLTEQLVVIPPSIPEWYGTTGENSVEDRWMLGVSQHLWTPIQESYRAHHPQPEREEAQYKEFITDVVWGMEQSIRYAEQPLNSELERQYRRQFWVVGSLLFVIVLSAVRWLILPTFWPRITEREFAELRALLDWRGSLYQSLFRSAQWPFGSDAIQDISAPNRVTWAEKRLQLFALLAKHLDRPRRPPTKKEFLASWRQFANLRAGWRKARSQIATYRIALKNQDWLTAESEANIVDQALEDCRKSVDHYLRERTPHLKDLFRILGKQDSAAESVGARAFHVDLYAIKEVAAMAAGPVEIKASSDAAITLELSVIPNKEHILKDFLQVWFPDATCTETRYKIVIDRCYYA